jgi:hypothetical protein
MGLKNTIQEIYKRNAIPNFDPRFNVMYVYAKWEKKM